MSCFRTDAGYYTCASSSKLNTITETVKELTFSSGPIIWSEVADQFGEISRVSCLSNPIDCLGSVPTTIFTDCVCTEIVSESTTAPYLSTSMDTTPITAGTTTKESKVLMWSAISNATTTVVETFINATIAANNHDLPWAPPPKGNCTDFNTDLHNHRWDCIEDYVGGKPGMGAIGAATLLLIVLHIAFFLQCFRKKMCKVRNLRNFYIL